MKKTHVLGLAVLAVFAFSAVAASSASAATVEWLKNGAAITSPEPSETTGSLELGNTSGLGTGTKVAVLCDGKFFGTVGPGAQDTITSVLGLSGESGTLTSEIVSCVNNENCPSPSVAADNLPWLTELREPKAGEVLDFLLNGGKGEPGWEVMCIVPIIGLVEEACTSSNANNQARSLLANDAGEGDVLGVFIKTENEKFLCKGQETGFVNTAFDGPGLITLTGGGKIEE
jgi:hypothetical protein